MKPRYQHDCSEEYGCTFVGQLGKYDIYRHDECTIARFGDDGPEYISSSLGPIQLFDLGVRIEFSRRFDGT